MATDKPPRELHPVTFYDKDETPLPEGTKDFRPKLKKVTEEDQKPDDGGDLAASYGDK